MSAPATTIARSIASQFKGKFTPEVKTIDGGLYERTGGISASHFGTIVESFYYMHKGMPAAEAFGNAIYTPIYNAKEQYKILDNSGIYTHEGAIAALKLVENNNYYKCGRYSEVDDAMSTEDLREDIGIMMRRTDELLDNGTIEVDIPTFGFDSVQYPELCSAKLGTFEIDFVGNNTLYDMKVRKTTGDTQCYVQLYIYRNLLHRAGYTFVDDMALVNPKRGELTTIHYDEDIMREVEKHIM